MGRAFYNNYGKYYKFRQTVDQLPKKSNVPHIKPKTKNVIFAPMTDEWENYIDKNL
jgi:hypothetical protein